jgi:peroxiredoxin
MSRASTGIGKTKRKTMSLHDALANLYSDDNASQIGERYSIAMELVADEEKRRVRQVGDCIPEFELTDPERGLISSSELLKHGPLVISFYRGLWCMYCQLDLEHLENTLPEIQKADASAIAVTRDLDHETRERFRQTVHVHVPVLDDVEGAVAQKFGLRWALDEVKMVESYLDLDLVQPQGLRPWILPMQARYVLAQDGSIAFANIAFSYDQRTEPSAILPTLLKLCDDRGLGIRGR